MGTRAANIRMKRDARGFLSAYGMIGWRTIDESAR